MKASFWNLGVCIVLYVLLLVLVLWKIKNKTVITRNKIHLSKQVVSIIYEQEKKFFYSYYTFEGFLVVSFWRGFLTNELRVASYELRATIYCTSYELRFRYELRVITYCMSYELLFRYELRVIAYCRS